MTWNSLLVLVLIVLSGFAASLGFVGVTSAEMQTAVWFAMTIIGVVIFSEAGITCRHCNFNGLGPGVANARLHIYLDSPGTQR